MVDDDVNGENKRVRIIREKAREVGMDTLETNHHVKLTKHDEDKTSSKNRIYLAWTSLNISFALGDGGFVG